MDKRAEDILNYWDIEMMKREKLLKDDGNKNPSLYKENNLPGGGNMPVKLESLGGGFDCIGNKIFRRYSEDSGSDRSSGEYDFNGVNDFG